MKYTAIFGLSVITMTFLLAIVVPKHEINRANRGALRVGIIGIPAAIMFIVWAVEILFYT